MERRPWLPGGGSGRGGRPPLRATLLLLVAFCHLNCVRGQLSTTASHNATPVAEGVTMEPGMTTEVWTGYRLMWLPGLADNMTEANRTVGGMDMFCVIISHDTPPPPPSKVVLANATTTATTTAATTSTSATNATDVSNVTLTSATPSPDNSSQFHNQSVGGQDTSSRTPVAPSAVSDTEIPGEGSSQNATETFGFWNCTLLETDFSSVPTNISNPSANVSMTELLPSETPGLDFASASPTETSSDVLVAVAPNSSVANSDNPTVLPSTAFSFSNSSVLPSVSMSYPSDSDDSSDVTDVPPVSTSSGVVLDSMPETQTQTVAIGDMMTSVPVSSVSLDPATLTDVMSESIIPTTVLESALIYTESFDATVQPSAGLDSLNSSSDFVNITQVDNSTDALGSNSNATTTPLYQSEFNVSETPILDSDLTGTSSMSYSYDQDVLSQEISITAATPPLSSDVILSTSVSMSSASSTTASHLVAPSRTQEGLPSSGEYWREDDEAAQNDVVSVLVSSFNWDAIGTPTPDPYQSEVLLVESSMDEIYLMQSSPVYEVFPSISDAFMEYSTQYLSDEDFMIVSSDPLEEILGLSSSYPSIVETSSMYIKSSLGTPVKSDTAALSPKLTSMATSEMDLQTSTQGHSVEIQSTPIDTSQFESESFIIPSSVDVVESSVSPLYSSSPSLSISVSDITASNSKYNSVPSAVESSTASALTTSPLGVAPTSLNSDPVSTTTSGGQAGPHSTFISTQTPLPSTATPVPIPMTSPPMLMTSLPSSSLSNSPSSLPAAFSSSTLSQPNPSTEILTSTTTSISPPPSASTGTLLQTSTLATSSIPPTSTVLTSALPTNSLSDYALFSTTASSASTASVTPSSSEQVTVTQSTAGPVEQSSTTTLPPPIVTTTIASPTTSTIVTTTTSAPPTTTTLITTPSTTESKTTTTSQTTSTTTGQTSTTVQTTNKQLTTSVGSTTVSTSPRVTQMSSIETTTETTSGVVNSTSSATTTSTPLTTTPVTTTTTEVPLNTSEAFREFWVKTVIAESPDVDVSAPSWVYDMEYRLVRIYDDGFKNLEEDGRRRRAVSHGDTTLQMVNASRDSAGGKNVTMVYFMERHGNMTPALLAVAAINTFGVQEVVLRLGKIVYVKAEVYAPPVVPPPHDPKYWLIGAVVGGIIGFILLLWCVLFLYCKCTRPAKTSQRTPRTPRSTRISMTGEFDTNSFRNKMPKIQNGNQKSLQNGQKRALPPRPVPIGKEVGFDIARTEVGLENEIQRDLKRKPPEPYRRRPDGSTELEGMYSAGETPPPKPMSYTNTPPGRPREAGEGEEGEQRTQTLNRNKSRSQIPIDASLRRSLPPRPDAQETIHPPKKKSSRKKNADSGESDSEDDRSEDRKPLSPDKHEKREKKSKKKKARSEEKPRGKGGRKKRRASDDEDEEPELDSSQAALYENVAKMSRGDNQMPEVKLRATQHAIRLPPLITQPLVGDTLTKSLREETELQESLQQKADIERWRNKQRQRERTKGSKGSRSHLTSDQKESRRAYRRAQREIGSILGDSQLPQVFQRKQKRKKSKHHKRSGTHPVAEASPDEMEMKDMFGPTDAQYSHLNGIAKQQSAGDPVDPADLRLESNSVTGTESSSETVSSSSDLGPTSPEPSLEEARQRMHALVDNAFAMIAPYHRRHNRVAPSHLVRPAYPPPPPAHGKASARARRRVAPQGGGHYRSQSQVVWRPEEDAGPRHTPLYVTPVTKMTSPAGQVVWSPYTAADEAARIPDSQQNLPGVIQTTPDVRSSRRGSVDQPVKPVRPVSAYNYSNPAYVKDPDNPISPRRRGSEQLESTTQSSPPEAVPTPRQIREALSQDDEYTSIVMDSRALNPGLVRSHTPPERDSDALTSSQSQDPGDTRQLQQGPGTNGVATVHPLSSQSGSLSTGSTTKSSGLLQTLPEQSSLQMPSTDMTTLVVNGSEGGSGVKKVKEPNLDPEVPKFSENPDEDEIDIIQRAVKSGKPGLSPWEKSLRLELERLANRSSADTTITTTALV